MIVFYPPVKLQLFGCMFLLGVILGILFDFLKVKRRLLGSSKIVVFIDDFLFSILSVILFLFASFVLNNGIIRWFAIVCLFIGFVLYLSTISKPIIYFFFKTIDCLKKVISKATGFVLRPVVYLSVKFAEPIEVYLVKCRELKQILRFIKSPIKR